MEENLPDPCRMLKACADLQKLTPDSGFFSPADTLFQFYAEHRTLAATLSDTDKGGAKDLRMGY